MNLELAYTPALELARLIGSGELSPVEVVSNALERIEAVNDRVNAFCFVYPDDAMVRAEGAARQVRSPSAALLPPLHGVPIAIKDFTPTRGQRTTLGSRVFEDWVPDWQPVIVDRLLTAGAIVVGKTTTPEFASAGFTRSALWGTTRNPWNLEHTPGGSSGGSGAAVAAGCVPIAEGTDIGGSIRGPASHCGVVGLKPSLGRIPCDLLDTVFDDCLHFGPLARTVSDAALFLNVTKGPHHRDIQSLPAIPDVDLPLAGDLRGRRFALSVDLGFYAVDSGVESNLREAAALLRDAGAVVEEVDLGWTSRIVHAWYDINNTLYAALFAERLPQWRERLEPDTVAMIEAGRAVSGAVLRRHEIVRTELWHSLAAVHERFDALLCPTEALPAPLTAQSDADFYFDQPDGRYYGVAMTMPFNLTAQCPVISVPTGFTASGLPTGMQIVGRRFDDAGVLDMAAGYERARPWAGSRPPL